jgi:hypothetical protein
MENDFNFIKGLVRVFNTLKYKYKDMVRVKDINNERLIKFPKVS